MLHNISLKALNTFGMDVKAERYLEISNELDITSLFDFDYNDLLILGGGSNVLFTKDIARIVVKNNFDKQILVEEVDDNQCLITIPSGYDWHSFVLYALSQNWGGIENLSLIPGTCGATPIQNIGAYGVELQHVLHSVHVADLKEKCYYTFSNKECNFGYRDSIFKKTEHKGRYFIVDITLRLTTKAHNIHAAYGDIQKILDGKGIAEPTIKDISNAVIQIRSSKLPDPKVLGNAGSFFKNPEVSNAAYTILKKEYPTIPGYAVGTHHTKIPAAWLIQECDWKGRVIGNVGSHKTQPLVLVNYGNAKGKEILDLANQIIVDVDKKFGILLTPEVNIF
jgi:UDP-N-acetylmuramate dehydrogenase